MIRRTLRLVFRVAVLFIVAVAVTIVALRLTNPGPEDSPGWTRLADLPVARGEVASAVLDGKLYVIGGLRGLGATDATVSIYDIERDRWSQGGSLTPLHHGAAAAMDGGVYVTGGARSARDWTPSDVMHVIGPDGESRTEPMPEGRQGHAMVAVRDRLYVVGGVGSTDRTLIYTDGRWRTGAPIPVGRDHLGAVEWRGRVWAIGGRAGDPVRRVDIYDPKEDDWSRGPDLPDPMSAMAVGVIDDTLHVVGGEDPDLIGGGVSAKHFTLERGADRWREGATPLLAVHGAGSGVYEGTLIVAGGASRQGALSTISWTPVTQVFDPRTR